MRSIERIEAIYIERGIGPRQVKGLMAKYCGKTPQAVHQWFGGSTKSPTAENLAAVAAPYNINLIWAITGKGPKFIGGSSEILPADLLAAAENVPKNLQGVAAAQLSALSIQEVSEGGS